VVKKTHSLEAHGDKMRNALVRGWLTIEMKGVTAESSKPSLFFAEDSVPVCCSEVRLATADRVVLSKNCRRVQLSNLFISS
jgi:hypothetical protein